MFLLRFSLHFTMAHRNQMLITSQMNTNKKMLTVCYMTIKAIQYKNDIIRQKYYMLTSYLIKHFKEQQI